MQEKSSHKAMESPRDVQATEGEEEVYLFTGNGVRPAMAVRAKSHVEAERLYLFMIHADDHE
jgi:hypothetical protein